MAVGALNIFLNKFEDWKFCPPSDHLWTISIVSNTNGKRTFGNLWSEIKAVNSTFSSIYKHNWKVELEFGAGGEDSYFGVLDDPTIGIFLATDINFNANSVIIRDNQSANSLQYTGFFSYAKTQTGRNHNHAIKVRFLKSNWDFNEIFIDSWIAAIGQQGLIEDSSLPNIKADITINEYAASAPGQKEGAWFLRKQVKLLKAFPKSRDQIEYTYSPDSAGEFKSKAVDFEFDGYEVKYFKVPGEGTKASNIGFAEKARLEGKESGINIPTPGKVDLNVVSSGKAVLNEKAPWGAASNYTTNSKLFRS